MLHLKTGLSWLGGRRLIAWREIVGHEALRGWEVRGGARRVRSTRPTASGSTTRCWSPTGFPKTAALLRGLGYEVAELEMSEYRKMDGGLSCLSVRW